MNKMRGYFALCNKLFLVCFSAAAVSKADMKPFLNVIKYTHGALRNVQITRYAIQCKLMFSKLYCII